MKKLCFVAWVCLASALAACSSASPAFEPSDSGPSSDGSSPEPRRDGAAPADAAAHPDAAHARDSGGETMGCTLSSDSILGAVTVGFVSGSPDCPTTLNGASASCSLMKTATCMASTYCTVEDESCDSWSGLGTLTAKGSAASGDLTLSDAFSGETCVASVSGSLEVSTGTPGACDITCMNGAPNNEMGCDPCLKKACAAEYAACLADNASSGCISCSQYLSGFPPSGIQCSDTPTVLMNLLNCGCAATTCD
jgi:hypothetical protein